MHPEASRGKQQCCIFTGFNTGHCNDGHQRRCNGDDTDLGFECRRLSSPRRDLLGAGGDHEATRSTLAHLRRGPAYGGHPRMRPQTLRFLGQPCPKKSAFRDSLTVLPLKFKAGSFLLVACCYQEGP